MRSDQRFFIRTPKNTVLQVSQYEYVDRFNNTNLKEDVHVVVGRFPSRRVAGRWAKQLGVTLTDVDQER